MVNVCRAALKPSPLFSTDIMNEPIAEGGLYSKFEILTGGVDERLAMLEALGTREQVFRLELAATKINEAERVPESNVIDLRTRKQMHSGERQLNWEIVGDAAPGRYSTGLFIFEVLGETQQIKRLALEAAHILR